MIQLDHRTFKQKLQPKKKSPSVKPRLESLKDAEGICFMSMKIAHLQIAQTKNFVRLRLITIKIQSVMFGYTFQQKTGGLIIQLDESFSCMNHLNINFVAAIAVDSRCARGIYPLCKAKIPIWYKASFLYLQIPLPII